MKMFVVGTGLLLTGLIAHGQTCPTLVLDANYGSASIQESFWDIERTSTFGFLLAGQRGNPPYFFITKTEEDFSEVWSQSLTSIPGVCRAVAPSSGGGYMLAGGTLSDGYIAKINSDGQIVTPWPIEYGGNEGNQLNDIETIADGGYVVGGIYDPTTDPPDAWVFKIDAEGDIVWQVTYGGIGSDAVYGILIASNGDILAVGRNDDQYCIRKMTENGELIWQQLYGSEDNYFKMLRDIIATSDGGYAACGDAFVAGSAHQGTILKVNANGSQQWLYNYGGWNDEVAESVTEESNGSLVIGGYTQSMGNATEFWLLRVNNNGVTEWEFHSGGQYGDYAHNMLEERENVYILAGITYSYGDLSDGNGYLTRVVGCMETPTTVISRQGTADAVQLNWQTVSGAAVYVVSAATTQEGTYSDIGTSTLTSYTDNGLQNQRFYKVKATHGPGYSDLSLTVGYVKVIAMGGIGTVSTQFGLPFKFWNIPAGIPSFGAESTNPSDICDGQLNCGTVLTADRILRQDNGKNALRNSASSCAWTGTLETSSDMTPGHAYDYQNRTGSDRVFVVAGHVDNTGNYGSLSILDNAYVPISWRDARTRTPDQLNLLDDGFIGGSTSLESDRVVNQVTGSNFWRRITDNTWQGSLTAVAPGVAYWVQNRHHDNGTWVYVHDGD